MKYVTDILLLDVVGFSRLSSERQLSTAMVITEKLQWTMSLLANQTFREDHELVVDFVPTGDGFYIILNPALAGYGVLLAPSLRSTLLLASRKAGNLYSGVHAAVHLGEALPFTDIRGQRNFVGDGLNDCARLLCAKQEMSPTSGIPEDDNFVVVSLRAWDQFEKTYLRSQEIKEFLDVLRFKWSETFTFKDKHRKEHTARFIESHRLCVVKPPPPADLKERMRTFAESIMKGKA